MKHTRATVFGALIAVLALSVAIAVPAFAAAEGGTSESAPAAAATPEASSPLEVTPLAEESCPSGNVCAWTQAQYQGTRGNSLCTGGLHTLSGLKYSAKNRCANKASWLRFNGVTEFCVNAGGNTPEITGDGFFEIWIGAEGSHC